MHCQLILWYRLEIMRKLQLVVTNRLEDKCDYNSLTGDDYVFEEMYEVTLHSGTTSMPIDVTINDDNIPESDETFILIINNNVLSYGVAFNTNKRTRVTITDDDSGMYIAKCYKYKCYM